MSDAGPLEAQFRLLNRLVREGWEIAEIDASGSHDDVAFGSITDSCVDTALPLLEFFGLIDRASVLRAMRVDENSHRSRVRYGTDEAPWCYSSLFEEVNLCRNLLALYVERASERGEMIKSDKLEALLQRVATEVDDANTRLQAIHLMTEHLADRAPSDAVIEYQERTAQGRNSKFDREICETTGQKVVKVIPKAVLKRLGAELEDGVVESLKDPSMDQG